MGVVSDNEYCCGKLLHIEDRGTVKRYIWVTANRWMVRIMVVG
jgi:hypothetical protein